MIFEASLRDPALQGLRIMVMRARHQAEPLCHKIEAAGGRAIRLPVIDIEPTGDTRQLDELIDRLTEFDLAIFVSVNAVQHALARIRARGGDLSRLKLAAIGHKTAAALAGSGYRVDICPPQEFTSEALLTLPGMRDLHGRQVIIFRGESGRELLAETLHERGATVQYAEVYRRVKPAADSRLLRQCFEHDGVDLITSASAEGLRNLDELCGIMWVDQLRKIPLLVGSPRILESARAMGFACVMTAVDPGDEAMFEAILRWAHKRHSGSR